MAVSWDTPFESPRQAVRLDAIGGRYDPWLLGAAIGLLLRISYELDRAQRQVARLRGASQ